MKIPMILLRLYVEFETFEELHKLVKKHKFATVSAAGRRLIEMGIKLTAYQEIMKDPEKKEKFIEELNSFMDEEKIFDWVETLDDNTKKAIIMAIELDNERKAPRQGSIQV